MTKQCECTNPVWCDECEHYHYCDDTVENEK